MGRKVMFFVVNQVIVQIGYNDNVCNELIGKNILREWKMKGPSTGKGGLGKRGGSELEVSLKYF